MAAEIPIIMAAEVAPVVAPLRWSQLDVQDWAHDKYEGEHTADKYEGEGCVHKPS